MFTVKTAVPEVLLVQAKPRRRPELVSANEDSVNRFDHNPPAVQPTSVFFTDRSIYRPGQTISYKGICIAVDQNQDNYTTIPNRAARG